MSGMMQMGAIGAQKAGWEPLWDPPAAIALIIGVTMAAVWIAIEARLHRVQQEERWPR